MRRDAMGDDMGDQGVALGYAFEPFFALFNHRPLLLIRQRCPGHYF